MYQWLRSVGSGRPTRSDEDVLVTNYMFLRKAVGLLGTFLPASVRAHFPWWLFLYEALAIFAFGVSWFVKGQTLIGPLKDAPAVAEPVVQH